MIVRLLRRVAFLASATFALFISLPAAPALADNCGSVSDCFFSADGATLALLATLFSIGLDFIPIVGDIKGVIEGIYGRDLITQQKLSPVERALGMAGMSELKWLSRAGDISSLLRKEAKLGDVTSTWVRQDTAWLKKDDWQDAFSSRWERRPSERPLPNSGAPVNADWNHILEGETKGNRVVGGHRRQDFLDHRPQPGAPPDSRIATEGKPDSYGAYNGSIERDRTTSPLPATKGTAQNPHTFYPDSWSPARIQQEVTDAFGNATIHPPATPGASQFWEGISPSGVKIQGWVTSSGEIATAYPVRLPDMPHIPAGVVGRGAADAIQMHDTLTTESTPSSTPSPSPPTPPEGAPH